MSPIKLSPVSPIKLSPVTIPKKLLTRTYCGTGVITDAVLDNMVKWDVSYPEYTPVSFTADKINDQTSLEHADIR